MDKSVSSEQYIADKLGRQIDTIHDVFADIHKRKRTVQIMIVIKQAHKQFATIDDRCVFLKKRSSGDIVFPSGTVEQYEINKGINPQSIILAAQRECKEELYGILQIDMSHIVDIFDYFPFQTPNGTKYMQLRMLASMPTDRNTMRWLETKFDSLYHKDKNADKEHTACYIQSCRQAIEFAQQEIRTLKDSTYLSIADYTKRCRDD